MAKLCPRGKAAAKRKFKVYPSAYANMYASAVCSGKVTPGGKKNRKKAMGGGMMDRPKFNKGGGADTGTIGELKSKLGVLENKVKRTSKRLKQRAEKMGGGMMNRPMYGSGGKACKLAMKGKGRAYGKNS
jgi:hypothetical protein